MALAAVYTRAQIGLAAPLVTVEVHLSGGMPGLTIVGLVETAVKESRERVKAAIRHAGFEYPKGKISVNLAPADLPKGGSWFDLAIAIGILAASGQVPEPRLRDHEFYGELAFTGGLRPAVGILPALLRSQQSGHCCVLPTGSAAEAGLCGDSGARLADHLVSVVRYLRDEIELAAAPETGAETPNRPAVDLADIRGQYQARRALEIAAAGRHNLLLIGPPGTGKTMLARGLPGLLPLMTESESLETAAVNSVAGRAPRKLPRRPPFRAPHHTASPAALVGGGKQPRPGEISLAHHGVLFLDELPEYARNVLEALREPLESGRISVARAALTVEFPARFQLVAAMNPCPCGFAGDRRRECRCSPDQVVRYQNRISGPFLDRVDMMLQLTREDWDLDDGGEPRESSAIVQRRVAVAAERQRRRAQCLNAELNLRAVQRWCRPDAAGRRLLGQAADRYALSARACDSVLRVARTIADLAEAPEVSAEHVAEALTLRRQINGPMPPHLDCSSI